MSNVLYFNNKVKNDDLRMFANELLESWLEERYTYTGSSWYMSDAEELFYLNSCNAAKISVDDREIVFGYLGMNVQANVYSIGMSQSNID